MRGRFNPCRDTRPYHNINRPSTQDVSVEPNEMSPASPNCSAKAPSARHETDALADSTTAHGSPIVALRTVRRALAMVGDIGGGVRRVLLL